MSGSHAGVDMSFKPDSNAPPQGTRNYQKLQAVVMIRPASNFVRTSVPIHSFVLGWPLSLAVSNAVLIIKG